MDEIRRVVGLLRYQVFVIWLVKPNLKIAYIIKTLL
jgi:hypothetical protein